jgi:hypothetical protein
MKRLVEEYRRISEHHWQAERNFFARVVLPSSVVRVFRAGTRPKLLDALVTAEIDNLNSVTSQAQFKQFFESQLCRLARVISRTNAGNPRVYPGYKWGHGTKILCLFLRDTVLHSHYFSEDRANRLSRYLYAPIDNIVISRLKELGYETPFTSIREIDSPEKFYGVQDDLRNAARSVGVPRVWFDDNWGQRV